MQRLFCPQTPNPGDGVSKSEVNFFQNMVMLHIKLKTNQVYRYMQSTPPPCDLREWVSNTTFSEHGHVAYENKENHECSDLVAIILPLTPHRTLGMGSVGQNSTFSEHGHVA